MSRERARSYADRLPPLVPREENDISHLSDAMADVLYPGRRPRPFRMGLAFDVPPGERGARARELARRSATFREEEGVAGPRVHAAFPASEAAHLRALFELVGAQPSTDVLVDTRPLPYGRELWLPLFWLFVGAR